MPDELVGLREGNERKRAMEKYDGVILYHISKEALASLQAGINKYVLPFWKRVDDWREWSLERMKRDKRRIR